MKPGIKRRLLGLILAAILLMGSVLTASAESVTETPPEIGAQFAVIFNADDNGEILYGKNENIPVYCGFLPRVMTCLLIMESGVNVDETVTVTKEMLVNTPQVSNVKLSVGDVISYRDLIACITLANAQEAAVAAAISLEGSLATFVEKMNQRARELGCENTRFSNVTGKYVSNTRQSTTLTDCSKILSEALKYPEILDPSSERKYDIRINGKTRTVYTRNMLIETVNANYNAEAKGLFIYSETESNSAIATYRKDSDRKIISVAITTEGLGSLYKDAGVLLKYSKNRYVMRTLLQEGKAIAEVKVKNGKDVDYVILLSETSVTALVPKIYNADTAELHIIAPEELEAPIEKGTILGEVVVSCGGKEYGTVNLKVQNGVELDYFELYSAKIVTFFSNPILWAVLGGLLLITGGYTLLLYLINRPRKKKRTSSYETGSRIRMTGGEDEDE